MRLRWTLLYIGLEVENRAGGKAANQYATILEVIESGKLDTEPKQKGAQARKPDQ